MNPENADSPPAREGAAPDGSDGHHLPIRQIKAALNLAVTVTFIVFIARFPEDRALVESPWFALLINFVLASWVMSLDHYCGLQIHTRLPTPQPKERPVYEALGVGWFKKLVRVPAYQMLMGPAVERGGEKHDLEELERLMHRAEEAHLAAFILVMPVILFALLQGFIVGALMVLGFALFFNAYPVMLQRYNRSRLHEIFRHAEERATEAEPEAGS
ncbi:MAG: hypothetical protein ACFB21_08775 [Opitutales bacterium]